MKVNTTNNNAVSFGRLTRDKYTMTKEMFETVSNIPVVKNFAKEFKATVSFDPFYSSRPGNRSQLALTFNDIKPSTFLGKVKAFFNGNKLNSIMLKTHAVNEEEFFVSLSKKPADALIKIFNKKR